MTDERPPDVLGSLPRTRPHRRSDKRPRPPEAPAAAAAAPIKASSTPTARKPPAAAAKPPKATKSTPRPRGTPARPSTAPRPPAPPPKPAPPLLGTAVQAAAELAEIGLSASARAVREMLSRLPRP